jgi:hypothetical protein
LDRAYLEPHSRLRIKVDNYGLQPEVPCGQERYRPEPQRPILAKAVLVLHKCMLNVLDSLKNELPRLTTSSGTKKVLEVE